MRYETYYVSENQNKINKELKFKKLVHKIIFQSEYIILNFTKNTPTTTGTGAARVGPASSCTRLRRRSRWWEILGIIITNSTARDVELPRSEALQQNLKVNHITVRL